MGSSITLVVKIHVLSFLVVQFLGENFKLENMKISPLFCTCTWCLYLFYCVDMCGDFASKYHVENKIKLIKIQKKRFVSGSDIFCRVGIHT